MKIDAARENFPKIKCGPLVKKVAHACSIAMKMQATSPDIHPSNPFSKGH